MAKKHEYDGRPDADVSWSYAEEYAYVSDILALVPSKNRDVVLKKLHVIHDLAFMAGATSMAVRSGLIIEDDKK